MSFFFIDVRGGGKKCRLWWFPKRSLDVSQGWKCGAPSENQNRHSWLIYRVNLANHYTKLKFLYNCKLWCRVGLVMVNSRLEKVKDVVIEIASSRKSVHKLVTLEKKCDFLFTNGIRREWAWFDSVNVARLVWTLGRDIGISFQIEYM